MKNIKIYYKGELDENLDDVIRDAFGRIEFAFVGSGYNFQERERDMEFEYQPLPPTRGDKRTMGILTKKQMEDCVRLAIKDQQEIMNRGNKEYEVEHSHTHCWEEKNPPCGQKGIHRCCLCEKQNPKVIEIKKEE